MTRGLCEASRPLTEAPSQQVDYCVPQAEHLQQLVPHALLLRRQLQRLKLVAGRAVTVCFSKYCRHGGQHTFHGCELGSAHMAMSGPRLQQYTWL